MDGARRGRGSKERGEALRGMFEQISVSLSKYSHPGGR
jgi:hypothetical protein